MKFVVLPFVVVFIFSLSKGTANDPEININNTTYPSEPITEVGTTEPYPTSPGNDTTTSTPTTTTSQTTKTTKTTATTTATTTTTSKPTTKTTLPTSPSPTTKTTVSTTTATPAPKTTAAPPPPNNRKFDGPSFVGGIVLALGLVAIGFVAFKFYKARTELNYHTL
ncbi:integumentary mucin C.1 [Aethina tumida]|uniref:integumentary mucin C.1 n=1 Tax=Aethina tumida TaxID=116153 RepID=UPI00096B2683|nr:integumentary mucin C.1 [Aethina tumida]